MFLMVAPAFSPFLVWHPMVHIRVRPAHTQTHTRTQWPRDTLLVLYIQQAHSLLEMSHNERERKKKKKKSHFLLINGAHKDVKSFIGTFAQYDKRVASQQNCLHYLTQTHFQLFAFDFLYSLLSLLGSLAN